MADRSQPGEDRVKSIFLRALRLPDLQERAEFVESACHGEPAEWQQVQRLLRHAAPDVENPVDGLLERMAPPSPVTRDLGANDEAATGSFEPDFVPEQLCGTCIGPYTLVELLGQGGMGTVYLAEQDEPICRQVALKLTKRWVGDDRWRSQFAAERAALERMDHAGIARVLDAGETEWGAQYIAMELVRGRPITRHCHERNLSPNDRLRLFIDVCRAVSHAHQKGIIHRDLKPSNLFVCEQDGKPLVKVIDFGIAATIDPLGQEERVGEGRFHPLGTPLYMSPEQAAGRSDRVDTRSDVYSLGVLLFELLADSRPRDSVDVALLIGGNGPAVDGRRGGGSDTPRPSQRVTDRRRAAWLRFELDWIVARAMETCPDQRYQTVRELADDVERVLANRPIEARPPSWRYRARKIGSRHGAVLSAVSVLLVTLLGAAAFSGWQSVLAKRARQQAETLLFAADLKLASDAFREANIRQARDRLARHIPAVGEFDRRNFAWHYLWNQLHPEVVSTHVDEPLFDVRYSPDGRRLISGDDDGRVILWDSSTGRRERLVGQHDTTVRRLAFSTDGDWVASASDDGQLKIWRSGDWRLAAEIEAHEEIVYDLAWVDNNRLASVGGGEVKLWDCGRLEAESDWPIRSGENLRASPRFEPMPATSYALAICNERNQLACGSRGDPASPLGLVRIWDLESGDVVNEIEFHRAPNSLAFDPMNRRLFIGTRTGQIEVVETATWQPIAVLEGHTSNVYRLDCSPDGRWLSSASKDATIRLWDLDGQFEPRVIQCHERRVYSVTFSPSGSKLVSASADGTMRQFATERTSFDRFATDGSGPISQPRVDASEMPAADRLMESYAGFHHPATDSQLMVDRVGRVVQWSLSEDVPRWLGLANVSESHSHLAVSDDALAVIRLDWWDQSIEPAGGLETPRSVPFGMIHPEVGGDEYSGLHAEFGQTGFLVWQPPMTGDDGFWQPPRIFGERPLPKRWQPASSPGQTPHRWYLCDHSYGCLFACRRGDDGDCELELIADGLPNDTFIQTFAGRDGPPGLLVVQPLNGRVDVCLPPREGVLVDWQQRIALSTQLTGLTAVCAFPAAKDVSNFVVIADEAGHLECHQVDAVGVSERRWQSTVPGRVWALEASQQDAGQRLHIAGPDGVFSHLVSEGEIVGDLPEPCLAIEGAAWACLPPKLAVYDVARQRLISRFHPLVQAIHATAISRDGSRVVVVGESGVVRLFSRSGTLLDTTGGLGDGTKSIVFSSDNRLACVTSADEIMVYDIQQRRLVHVLEGHDNAVGRLAFAKGRPLLASASRDLSVRLWSLDSGQQIAVLVGHTAVPDQLCFSPDERLLVSAARDGVVKVWDIETRSEVLELTDCRELPVHLAFESPDRISILTWAPSPEGLPGYALGRWAIDTESANTVAATR